VTRKISKDKEEFSTAIRLLRQCVAHGDRLPLYYTLPTGRSIEGLCDRLRGVGDAVPLDVKESIRHLADNLAVIVPDKINYETYSMVLREIALRLTLPFDQRRAPLTKGYRFSGSSFDDDIRLLN